MPGLAPKVRWAMIPECRIWMSYWNGREKSMCDDALFSVIGGTYFLDFYREAETLEGAIRTAREDVARADIGSSEMKIVVEGA
jgi:hypothetical protein